MNTTIDNILSFQNNVFRIKHIIVDSGTYALDTLLFGEIAAVDFNSISISIKDCVVTIDQGPYKKQKHILLEIDLAPGKKFKVVLPEKFAFTDFERDDFLEWFYLEVKKEYDIIKTKNENKSIRAALSIYDSLSQEKKDLLVDLLKNSEPKKTKIEFENDEKNSNCWL